MIDIESVGEVDVLRLDHGKVNALDLELLGALGDELERVGTSDRAAVITGNGRVFCAGVDLRRALAGGRAYAAELIPALHRAFMAVFTCPRPVVAAIDGAAIAGGCIIAAACDHRLMTDRPAPIGTTELVVGVPFPVAAIEIMHHTCGHRAAELVLRAETLSLDEAVGAGLVERVAPPDLLLAEAIGAAARLASFPAEAYTRAKRQLRAPAVERIERDAPSGDLAAADLWGAPETAARIADQLARLAPPRP
jgi:enoyl-CoA hydratase